VRDFRRALAAQARTLGAFLRYLRLRFEADQCTRTAAALAYTSLLALVPLFTVVFVALSAFPAFADWRDVIERFVFENFVPALGAQVRAYLTDFSAKARGLQAVGVTILLATVLLMMATIEAAFNVIWGVRRRRPLVVRFLVYWSVLTLGPILIGAGMVATSYVISLPLIARHGLEPDLQGRALALVPVVASTLAFVMFFKLIPYRPVPTRHALIGGILASILFELAKRGFAIFVTRFAAQEAIYGAFATVPIFLTWLYLSWLIVLLGAEITHCLTTFRGLRAQRGLPALAELPFYPAYRVLLHLHDAQMRGASMSDKDIVKREPALGYAEIDAALEALDRAGWVARSDDFEWMLARDLDRVTVLDLLRIAPCVPAAAVVEGGTRDPADHALASRLREFVAVSESALALPLADLLNARVDSDLDARGLA